MAKRRGNREGTIYKRPNGTWCAQVSVDGRRLTKYARTQRECRAWLTEKLADIGKGLSVDASDLTMAEFLPHWLEVNRKSWAASTRKQYRQIVTDHILPTLGEIRLQRLRPDQIQRMHADASSGARTIQLTHAVLRRALNQAVLWDLLTSNPARAIRPPQVARSDMKVLTAEHVNGFLAACADHRLHALFHLAITTGLRQGELLGLWWTDLDAKNGTLHIQRQLRRIPGEGLQLTEPKSTAGRRSIVLGEPTVAKLRAHRKRQLEERVFFAKQWHDQGLIFTNTWGGPVDPSKLYKQFRAILDQAGLAPIRFHDLRHTAATLMLQQGVHPKVIQERLGHSSISITLDTYSHIVPSLQREAAEAVDALIS